MDTIFLLILAIASAARLQGCFSDLWLDEIWMVRVAEQSTSFLDIFTQYRDMMNQHLNTLIIYFLGNCKHLMVYRIHSLACGIGTVVLAWFISRRLGRGPAIIASFLTGGSYLLIHYSSEARGYSLVVFFSLATLFALERLSEKKSWFWAGFFWICAALGFMSHLIYLHTFIAVAVWFLVHLLKTCETKQNVLARYAQCFSVPIVFLGCFYFFVLKYFSVFGSGPPYKLFDVLVKTLSYTGGGPAAGPLAVSVSFVTAGLFLWAIIHMWRKGNSEWIFYLIVVLISPLVLLTVKKPEMLALRYFLVNVAFIFLPISYLLADLYRRSQAAKVFVTIVLALFLAGNGVNISGFIKYGRGGYLEGLQYIADHTPGQTITIGSDHDFRNGMLVEFYKRYFPTKNIFYKNKPYDHPNIIPAWFICHQIGKPGEIPLALKDRYGNMYELVKTLPYYDLSGWHWFIYRKHAG